MSPVEVVLSCHGTVYHPELSNIQTVNIGNWVTLHSHVWIGERVRIGHSCKIQAFAFIPNGVVLHDLVFIGPRVTFTNDKHPPNPDYESTEDTIVEEGVSIGAGAIILPGIHLGKRCVVGAGSVVTRDVKAGITVVGNPARPLK